MTVKSESIINMVHLHTEKGDWIRDTVGCKASRKGDFIICQCNHLSFFGVEVVGIIICTYVLAILVALQKGNH